MFYPLIKVFAPSAVVGVANLVTYLSFSAYTNTQNNNRNLRIKNQFNTVKKSVFDQIINNKESLMQKRHGEIVNYLKNQKNQETLKRLGANSLVEQWQKVAPNRGQNILQDDFKKSDFFQEVRLFCSTQKDTEEKELIIIVSKLCSEKIVTEKDFLLPEELNFG